MRASVARGLDLRKPSLAMLMVIVGVVGRLLLLNYANFETVLVSTFFAGALLGGVYTIVVPVAIMGISDSLIYTFQLGNQYGLVAIAGIAFFTWSGFLMIAVLGRFSRPRAVLATKGIAAVTGIGLLGTLLFDLWTAFGMWLFIASPTGHGLDYVYVRQIPFTVYHLLSSLIFIPIFGTLFIHLDKVGFPRIVLREAPSASPGKASGLHFASDSVDPASRREDGPRSKPPAKGSQAASTPDVTPVIPGPA